MEALRGRCKFNLEFILAFANLAGLLRIMIANRSKVTSFL
jgi:hypothetical protein